MKRAIEGLYNSKLYKDLAENGSDNKPQDVLENIFPEKYLNEIINQVP